MTGILAPASPAVLHSARKARKRLRSDRDEKALKLDDRRHHFLQYFDDMDAADLRQRSLFLRHFEELKAAGLDPVAAMDLVFGNASGVVLRRMIAGMRLFRDRCRPPGEFFWALENAQPPTRDQVFKLLNWDDPAGLAAELDGIITRQATAKARFRRAQTLRAIKTVDELIVPALRKLTSKFDADGKMPGGIFPRIPGIPGTTVAAVLNAYRGSKRKRGPRPLREMAVAILLRLERSDEDPAEVLRSLDAARKETRRPRRKR